MKSLECTKSSQEFRDLKFGVRSLMSLIHSPPLGDTAAVFGLKPNRCRTTGVIFLLMKVDKKGSDLLLGLVLQVFDILINSRSLSRL
jgi:hypothetical protein